MRGRIAAWIFLCLLVTMPFVGKAIHIDDEVFVRQARQFLTQPSGFYSAEQPLFGKKQSFLQQNQHPPLNTLFLAAIIGAFPSGGEVLWHSVYAGFYLAAVGFAILLFRKLTRNFAPAALVWALSPALVVSAHSLMTDVPFNASYLLALAIFFHAFESKSARYMWLGSLAAVLCAYTQYRGLTLGPIIILLAWSRSAVSPRLCVAAFFPWFLTLAHQFLVGLNGQGWPFFESASFLEWQWSRYHLSFVSYLTALGMCFLVPGIQVIAERFRRHAPALLCSTVIGGMLVWIHRRSMAPQDFVLALVLVAIGGFVLSRVVEDAWMWCRALLQGNWRRPSLDEALSLTVVTLFASIIFMGLFACLRNLLIVLPLMTVILFRKHPDLALRGRLVVTVSVSVILAALCAVSDYEWAGYYRNLAKQQAGVKAVCFTGEWGFRYYMEEAGARYLLNAETDLPPQTTVIRPTVAAPGSAIDEKLGARLTETATVHFVNPIPLTLMAEPQHNCGWYSEGSGILPFCLGWKTQETIKLFVRD